jgi:hypothetical protein
MTGGPVAPRPTVVRRSSGISLVVGPDGLTFLRQPMVDWLRPSQLAKTGLKAALSGVFGAYADKRELQAALHPWSGTVSPYDGDYSRESQGDFWFDFVADLGDGFDSTYAIAWLLSRPELRLPGPNEPALPRGRFLVLGGDQVYPTASRDEYQNRFRGPYEAAFPSLTRKPDPSDPDLFAIPGNHDWYDGLTSFTRLFCQSRRIGRWATRQTRSYFAIRLPYNWWLWGVDIQLASDIDRPQMEYFARIADEMKKACPDENDPPRLILCTGQPTWADCGAECPDRRGLRRAEPHLFDNEAFLEERIIKPRGVRLVATLSGDLHHYMRYAEEARGPSDPGLGAGAMERPETHKGVQRITSGGGGAYLYPTHHMPNAIELEEGDQKVRYRRQGMYPGEAESHLWARRIRWLPFRNWRFSFFLGAIYLLFAWTLQSASKAHPIPCGGGVASLMECLQPRGLSPVEAMNAFWQILKHSPSNVVFGLFVIFGLYQFRASEDESAGRWWGAVHGAAHVLLNFALIWAISIINLRLLPLDLEELRQALLFLVEMLVGGGLLGAALFALYLWASSKDHGCHINEVFSSQHIADCKNFLRLRINPQGTLTIHPIGVPTVPKGRDWTVREAPRPGDALIDPPAGGIALTRIEPDINCR